MLVVPVLPSPADPCDWAEHMDDVPLWRHAQKAWAAALGVTLPDYRYRCEYEDARVKCEAALAACQPFLSQPAPEPAPEAPALADEPDDDAPIIMKPRILPPKDAAELFLSDICAIGETGPYDDAQLRQLYLEHCARYDLEPTPENMMRDELKTMPGIWKKQFNEQRGGSGGKRKRNFKWMLATDVRAAS